MVVPGSTPFVHVRPASCDVDQARLLEPPFVKRPLCATATIVSPKLNESGSSCVLCWLVLFVYGSELIACGACFGALQAVPPSIEETRPPVSWQLPPQL